MWLLRFHPEKCKVVNISRKMSVTSKQYEQPRQPCKTELHLYSNDEEKKTIPLEIPIAGKDIGVLIAR